METIMDIFDIPEVQNSVEDDNEDSFMEHSYSLETNPFECEDCGQCFKLRSILSAHYRVHKWWPHYCHKCSKGFPTEFQLQMHLDNCRGKRSRKPSRRNFEAYKNDFETHCRIDKEKESFFCLTCKKGFANKAGLRRHLRIVHSDRNPQKCDHCGRVFMYIGYFKNHACFRQKTKFFVCDVCGIEYVSRKNYKNHLASHVCKCRVCDIIFPSKDELEQHNKEHKSERPFLCHVCGGGFRTRKAYNYHRDSEHAAGEKNFQCSICGKSFWKKYLLTMHSKTHEIQRKKIHTCQICKKGVKGNSAFQAHLRRHRGEKPHLCDVCNKRFYTKDRLNYHPCLRNADRLAKLRRSCTKCHRVFSCERTLRIHLTPSKTAFKCEVCCQKFLREHTLKEHLFQHSKAEVENSSTANSSELAELEMNRPYKCEVCCKVFANKSTLRTHMFCHKEKAFICKVCGKAFSLKNNMNKHLLLHEAKAIGVKNFCCHLCDKSFLMKSHLLSHMSRHRIDRPYKCEKCGKAFKTRGVFSKHKLIHLEVRSHVCDVCNKGFITAGVLNMHKKVHTGIRPLVCKICGKRFLWSSVLKKHLRMHEKLGENIPLKTRVKRCLKSGKFKKSEIHIGDVKKENDSLDEVPETFPDETATPRKKHSRMSKSTAPKRSPKKKIVTKCLNHEKNQQSSKIFIEDIKQENEIVDDLQSTFDLPEETASQYECNVCWEGFSDLSDLERHCQNHFTLSCYICEEKFVRNTDLLKHQMSHRTKNSKIKCPLCELTFTTNMAGNKHIDEFHSDDSGSKSSGLCKMN